MVNAFSKSALEISNLMYRYNELIDGGDLEGASTLFRYAKLKLVTSDELQNDQAFLDMLRKVIWIYADGTPKTKHIVTNPIIEIDEEKGSATARSQYTVFQATDGFPFQVVAGGRYDDRFECVDGRWRFSYRDFTLFDFQGDISAHLRLEGGL